MATKKAAGSTKNLSDSKPKYLGLKRAAGQLVKLGEILVRQRGTRIEAGAGTKVGKDHTIFAVADGTVAFRTIRKKRFNGQTVSKKSVEVHPAA